MITLIHPSVRRSTFPLQNEFQLVKQRFGRSEFFRHSMGAELSTSFVFIVQHGRHSARDVSNESSDVLIRDHVVARVGGVSIPFTLRVAQVVVAPPRELAVPLRVVNLCQSLPHDEGVLPREMGKRGLHRWSPSAIARPVVTRTTRDLGEGARRILSAVYLMLKTLGVRR